MLADTHSFHVMIVFIRADRHSGLANDIGNLAAVIQNTLFHLVNITAQLRKFRTALDINGLVQISLGYNVEFVIDTVNAFHHIPVHIAGNYIIQNYRNGNETERNPCHCGWNPPVHILTGNHPSDIVFARLHKHTEGLYAVYIRKKAVTAGRNRFKFQAYFHTVFFNAGQIRRTNNISGFFIKGIIIGVGVDTQQGKNIG